MSEEMVTITKSEYQLLKADAAKLRALERAGVDNWEWYGDAMDSMDTESSHD
jgi:uncharacterized protein YlaN (UPF0358 family)